MAKVFRTYRSQVRILRGRGLNVPTNGNPIRVLEKTNYYNLINGYKDLFIDTLATPATPERYKIGSHFSEIVALYDFDAQLRFVFLKRLLMIERAIKAEIAYAFSERHGYDNYLTIVNFDMLPMGHAEYNRRLEEIVRFISNVQHDTSKGIVNESIRHYMTQHGYVPLWVLMNILSFGRVSYFYRYMQQTDRQAVARLYNITDREMSGLLHLLTNVRNICAHDDRLYSFRSHVEIANHAAHTRLAIPRVGAKPIQGKSDLFAALISISTLLGRREFARMKREIQEAFNRLDPELSSIAVSDVQQVMGFPPNWYEL